MISPDTLDSLTRFSTHALARALANSGYSGHSFREAEFVGINGSGQFCYRVSYYDETVWAIEDQEPMYAMVFLTYDHLTNGVSAEF